MNQEDFDFKKLRQDIERIWNERDEDLYDFVCSELKIKESQTPSLNELEKNMHDMFADSLTEGLDEYQTPKELNVKEGQNLNSSTSSGENVGSKKPDDSFIQTNGSLDCCSKEQIDKNKKEFLICSVCNNTGYLSPVFSKEEKPKLEKYSHDSETNTTYAYTKESVDKVLHEIRTIVKSIALDSEGEHGVHLLQYIDERLRE